MVRSENGWQIEEAVGPAPPKSGTASRS